MRTGVRGRWIAIGALSTAIALVGVLVGVATAGPGHPGEGAFLRMAAPAAPAAPKPPARTVRIAAVGDVILGSTPKLPPDDGRTFFDDVRPVLTGDVVTGNLESPLTDRTFSAKCLPPSPWTAPSKPAKPSEPNRCFAFRVPPGYARWIAGAGFTVVNIANNHARDYGPPGLRDTTAALASHGVAHTGFAGQITRLSANGVRVAVLGFSPYGWTNSVLDVEAAAALVRRASVGADVVVVNMHVGAEGSDATHVRRGTETFLGEERGDPIRFAHAVVDAGADLVVGHSPHVLRGMEFYKGKLIVYSLGNFAGGGNALSADGVLKYGGIVHVTLTKDGTFVRGKFLSTYMNGDRLPTRDDTTEKGRQLVGQLTKADFPQTGAVIGGDGSISPSA